MTIIDKLKSVTKSANGWEAQCPAHEDTHSSLSIAHRDGRWLLNCHAGCSVDAVVSAIGLKISDLFDNDTRKRKANGKSHSSPFVAEYIYRTAEGELSRKVCRTADKQFPQFRWTESKWQSGTEGIPVLPYRLPELVKAEAETPVFICEGEKDCDRLFSLGFVATTNPMGAGKWRAGLNKWFADRPVFVIPDNDEPGRKHATDIVRHLKPVAARVRIVELPGLTKKGGDVSDWLDADQNNRDRLLDVALAPPKTLKACDGAALLDDVYAFLKRFIVYPSAHAHIAHVLWIAHAHLMSAWESTPRIAFLSPEPASGKTRSMEVTELLVPNPVAAVNVTPAYMFRKCAEDDGPPTILFDEIDTVFGAKAKEHEELRALLNSGHRRGATAGRCIVRGQIVETEEIPSYAAVALAGLGWLPDTILSRSIIVRMRRRAPDEKVEAFRRRVHAPVGHALRKRLAEWAIAVVDEATEARPDMPTGVEDRNADCWESLLAIADIAGGDWPERACRAAMALVQVAREVEPSLNLRLLADLRTIYADRKNAVAAAVPAGLSTKAILAELCRLEDAPWSDLKGKPLNDNQLGRRLRHYEIRSKNLKPHGEDERKGYLLADFADAWRRYLPPLSGEPVEPVEPVEPAQYRAKYSTAAAPEAVEQPVEPSNVAAQNPNKTGAFDGSTASTAFPGNGGDQPGLSWRAVDRLARQVEDWAHARREQGETTPEELEAEIARRLNGFVLPDALAIEVNRVMACLFETREARR